VRAKVPPGWCVATIMDIATTSGGGTPPKADAAYWAGGELPWVSPKDMKRFLVNGSEDAVTAKALERLTLVPTHSVLVVVRSGILSRTLPVSINVVPVTINQDMRAFVPSRSVEPRYVAWQLIANERAILDRCAKDGTTVASIEGPALASHPFAVAPAAEQTRIVDKLEELLSDLDAGVAELKAAQKKLAQYRQSLLKAAVEGQLTEAWRAQNGEPEESGAQLLARILRERRARWEAKQFAKFKAQRKAPLNGWQEKYPEPAAVDVTGLPNLPRGWVWASADQLTAESSYGTSVKCSYESDGTPVLRIPNIARRELDFGDIKFANEPLQLAETEYLAQGDVLVVRTNGSIGLVGRAAAIDTPLNGAFYFASYLLRLRLAVNTGLPIWVSAFLGSSAGRAWIEKRAASSAGQHNISLSTLLTLPVPLPPMVEQHEALAALRVALEAAAGSESDASTALRQSAAQRKNILRAAFSGQLVPQDPNDEPASVLLERIRAERMNQPTKSRKPRVSRKVQ